MGVRTDGDKGTTSDTSCGWGTRRTERAGARSHPAGLGQHRL